MNRAILEQHIFKTYGINAENTWIKYPGFSVFRHSGNQKWFAVIMEIPKSRLCIGGSCTGIFAADGIDMIDVVKLRCDCGMISYLIGQQGFFPAYHMDKTHWITVALDGSVDFETVSRLIQVSFELTSSRKNS